MILDPNILTEHITKEERNKIVSSLGSILNISPESINQAISKNPKSRYQIIKKHIKADTAQIIKEKDLMGVWLEEDSYRNYVRMILLLLIRFVNVISVPNMGLNSIMIIARGVSGRVFPM